MTKKRNENQAIKEFSTLAADANIYKLVGPVLLKQDKSEASLAVDRRLEFIDKEMYVWMLCLLDISYFAISNRSKPPSACNWCCMDVADLSRRRSQSARGEADCRGAGEE